MKESNMPQGIHAKILWSNAKREKIQEKQEGFDQDTRVPE